MEVYWNLINLNVIFSSVFKPDELRQALMPTLEKLYRQDPESMPFRQPVDPVMLNIPVSFHHYKFLLSSLTKKRMHSRSLSISSCMLAYKLFYDKYLQFQYVLLRICLKIEHVYFRTTLTLLRNQWTFLLSEES